MDGKTFNETQGDVMRESGTPDIRYYVFDYVKDDVNKPYSERIDDLKALNLPSYCKKLVPIPIKDEKELLEYEKQVLKDGYEGVMLRTYGGPYKQGRSTVKEGHLLKLKRFKDSEAKIIGFEEQMHNSNEQTKDAFGYSKRSSHKAGMVPMDTLGAFIVQDIKTGVTFKVSTGMDAKTRKEVWDNRDSYKGKLLKYKYQEVGQKDLPRFPVWLGFRDVRDL
jgi:DNA ligase-1